LAATTGNSGTLSQHFRKVDRKQRQKDHHTLRDEGRRRKRSGHVRQEVRKTEVKVNTERF
jgi:hypothetical protein